MNPLLQSLPPAEEHSAEVRNTVSTCPRPLPARESRYDGLTLYLTEIGRLGRLTQEQELALARRARAGDTEARQALVEAHLRLVVSVARAYAHCGVPLLDLVAEGNVGLMRAAERFDCEQEHRFSTYAVWWVRNAIFHALANQAQVIRIPPHLIEALRRLNREREAFGTEHHREPTREELASRLQLPLTRVETLLRVEQRALSLHAQSPGGDQSTLLDRIEDVGAESPFEIAAQHLLRHRLEELLGGLSGREREVLELRFGLEDGTPWSRAAIGRRFGVTREAIRQLEISALKKLRHPSRLRRLRVDGDDSELP